MFLLFVSFFFAATLFLFVCLPVPSQLLFCDFRFYFLWQFRPASLHPQHPPHITYDDAQPLRYVSQSRSPPCRGGRRRFLYGWLLSLSLAGDWTELLIGPNLLLPPGPPSSNCHTVIWPSTLARAHAIYQRDVSYYGQARLLVPLPSTSGTFVSAHAIIQRDVSLIIGQVVNREYHKPYANREPSVRWSTASTTSRTPIGNQRR